ncbi:IS4 family transposase [Endozoicomonas sp.]|uniref:IS4 family transposase n=1 Tax=Endozoicomonas sp. TaxID=1892382 RepID=UPI002888AD91|nr:IS4 family transposase [Endozoicomonas sp.]
MTDGSTVSGPDTEANQKKYPQPSTQKKGLGFPIIRILVLITLASGALLDAAVAPYSGKETGEQALLRQMFDSLNEGDILLGDANFENYFILAALISANIDGVFEKNGSRILDFRKCYVKLGSKEGLFKLKRPDRPPWMDEESYSAVPKEIIVRAIKTKKRIIVTTLTDTKLYPRKDISDLYIDRWHIELDFRCIKTMMKMEVLRCKTPEMLRKEIYVHLLVYNLIRALMAKTAETMQRKPREVSFKTAQDTLLSYHYLLLMGTISIFQILEIMIQLIGKHKVGNRPGRSEPRAVKRRSKPTKKLQHPRKQARRLTEYKG